VGYVDEGLGVGSFKVSRWKLRCDRLEQEQGVE
jgi:hypothetical protein